MAHGTAFQYAGSVSASGFHRWKYALSEYRESEGGFVSGKYTKRTFLYPGYDSGKPDGRDGWYTGGPGNDRFTCGGCDDSNPDQGITGISTEIADKR